MYCTSTRFLWPFLIFSHETGTVTLNVSLGCSTSIQFSSVKFSSIQFLFSSVKFNSV
uniref:Uncharacterized protein n=1 Tax=Anguilla anguilla TaxID=7936 RepID=A0A0E9R2X5_ANGAN